MGKNFDLLPTPKGAYIDDGELKVGNDSEGYCDYMCIGCITSEEDAGTYTVTDKDGAEHTCAHPGCVGERSCVYAGSDGGVVYCGLGDYPSSGDGLNGVRLQYHGDYEELSNIPE